uniref:Uncharacterized protein n=1 Tax=Fagus sylvatica TaxID=28930 RepID=A0A2N9FAG1_FAGSY
MCGASGFDFGIVYHDGFGEVHLGLMVVIGCGMLVTFDGGCGLPAAFEGVVG